MGLTESACNAIYLAANLLSAVERCDAWWATVSMTLQRFKSRPWGLMLHVTNHGGDEAEARKFWGVRLDRLGKGIEALPKGFRSRAEG